MDRLPGNVSRWIKERQIISEIILAALVLLTAALKFRNMTGADDAFILAMLALASFYFLTAFLHRQESKVVIIVTQVFQIASSVSVIGLLFTFYAVARSTGAITHRFVEHDCKRIDYYIFGRDRPYTKISTNVGSPDCVRRPFLKCMAWSR